MIEDMRFSVTGF